MAPPRVNLAILDDDVRWADNLECGDLLFAGVWFLHDTLISRHPRCPLLGRITQLGDQFERLRSASGSDPSKVTAADASAFFAEMNTVGTLGHSLWQLKGHLDAPGLRYELNELSQL